MIYELQERIFKIDYFRKMNLEDLRLLLENVTDREHWLLTTENYDSKKYNNLYANEKKILKVLFK